MGAPTPQGRQRTNLPNFPQNCMKLKEFGPPGFATVCMVKPTSYWKIPCIGHFHGNPQGGCWTQGLHKNATLVNQGFPVGSPV